MNKSAFLFLCGTVMLLTSGLLAAQDYEWHPALSDSFSASLGAMRSSNSYTIEANGIDDDPGTEIDFGDTLGVSQHSTFFNGQLKWKFGSTKKWSLAGQYFSNSANGEAILTEDLEWDGNILLAGSYAEAGAKLSVVRLFLGYSLSRNERNDFGIGAGLHNLDIEAFIEGEFIAPKETISNELVPVSASQPLPNIGTWYNFSPARRWLLHARVDWISANIGDYDGTLWNANFGVNFQAWHHVGVDLSWQYFNLNLGVDSTDWNGRVDMIYSGPALAVTFNW